MVHVFGVKRHRKVVPTVARVVAENMKLVRDVHQPVTDESPGRQDICWTATQLGDRIRKSRQNPFCVGFARFDRGEQCLGRPASHENASAAVTNCSAVDVGVRFAESTIRCSFSRSSGMSTSSRTSGCRKASGARIP